MVMAGVDLVSNNTQLKRLVEDLWESKQMGVDFETTGLDQRRDHPLLLGIGHEAILVQHVDMGLLRPVIESPKHIKVFHNAPFDGGHFQRLGMYPRGVVCTMLGEMLSDCGLLRPRGWYGLGSVLGRRLGVHHDKGLQTSFGGADPKAFRPSEEQVAYLLRDILYLPDLAGVLKEELAYLGLLETWALENRFTQVIAMMQLHGAPLDLEAYREKLVEKDAEYEELAQQVSEALTPPIMEVRRRRYEEQMVLWTAWEREKADADMISHTLVYDTRTKGNKEELARYNALKRLWKEEHPAPFSAKPKPNTNPITVTSSQQIGEALRELGMELKNTERATLLMARPEAPEAHKPILDTLGRFSDVKRFREGYGTLMLSRIDEDNRLRSAYRLLKTGRVASAKWKDKGRCNACGAMQPFYQPEVDADEEKRACAACDKPLHAKERGTNLQNPHKLFKEYVRPPEGRCFVMCDYSQVELRVAAEYILRARPAATDAIVKAFRDGEDPHSRTASFVSGLEYEYIRAHHETDPEIARIRKAAKTTNFSCLFWISAKSLAARIYVAREDDRPFTSAHVKEAQDFIDAFWALNPSLKPIQEEWARQALNEGHTVTLGGRRRFYPLLRSGAHDYTLRGRIERAASNHPIQGTAADIAKRAANELYGYCRDIGILMDSPTFLWNAVHDELCVETADDLGEDVRDAVERIALNAYSYYVKSVPGEVACKVEYSWKH